MIAEFSAVLVASLVFHNLADHVTGQTDFIAENKTHNPKAMAGHILWYHVTMVVGLLAVIGLLQIPVTGFGFIMAMLFSAASHAFIDTRTPVRRLLEITRSPGFAKLDTPINGMYVSDQALHWTCLLISALLMIKL